MAESKVRRRRRNPKAAYAMEFQVQDKQVLFEVTTPDAEQAIVKGSIHDGRQPLVKLDLWLATRLFNGDLDPAAAIETLDHIGEFLDGLRPILAQKAAELQARTAVGRRMPTITDRDRAGWDAGATAYSATLDAWAKQHGMDDWRALVEPAQTAANEAASKAKAEALAEYDREHGAGA